MSRWKAAAIHLAINAAVAALAATLLFGLWYPPPYFQASGADRLLLLLAGIDLVLGPLLTLIVFRSGKPSLRFDLTVIGLLQVAALVYGLHVMLQSRPVYLVGAVDRFVLVSANELDPADLAAAPAYRRLSWTGPRLVAARLPTTANERNALLSAALDGKDIERLPRYYVDYPLGAPALLARAQPFETMSARHPHAAPAIARWLADSGKAPTDLVWLPLVARSADLVLVLRRGDGQPVGALPIDPW